MNNHQLVIGIIAPASKVPQVEFELGLRKIRDAGFETVVHPSCKKSYQFFAGTDEDRAKAFLQYAYDPEIPILWCARGGYGSIRLISHFEKWTREHGVPPKKLLVGYSDCTAIDEWVRVHWGWSVLHASMPGSREFYILPEKDWKATIACVARDSSSRPWEKKKLKIDGEVSSEGIAGELVGGNLSVWTSMIGTPHAGDAKGKIVFFEDIDESLYRIDRMVQQLIQSRSLEGARAVVLGNFLNCKDQTGRALAKMPSAKSLLRTMKSPKDSELIPMRKVLNEKKAIPEIFAQATRELGIPLAYHLPSGHGPDKAPLPIGATYRLSADGKFSLLHWSWWE